MSNTMVKERGAATALSSVTDIVGVVLTLPGENEDEYRQGLESLIKELGAETPMQIYIAEKIFECLWWMRRYEKQKQMTLVREMAKILTDGTRARLHRTMHILLDPKKYTDFVVLMEEVDHTEETLQQTAFANVSTSIANLNQQIAMMSKTLKGFQASYEVLVSRKLNLERMRLQNRLLSEDLNAVDSKALPNAS